MTELALPSPTSDPMGIVAGPDGNLWFAESSGMAVGRISLSGELTEFPVPYTPSAITVGPDGNVWFIASVGSRIGRITPAGIVAELAAVDAGNNLAMSAGADGNVWFGGANYRIPSVGRVSPAGTVETIPLPLALSTEIRGMALGADGAIWYTNAHSIIRLTPEGATTEFGAAATPTRGRPEAIGAGLNGDLWFSESSGGVGRITLSGELSESAVPTDAVAGYGIAVGPDGDVWFTEASNKIGRLSASGTFVEYDIPTKSSFPYGIAVAADGSVWFTERYGGKIGRIKL